MIRKRTIPVLMLTMLMTFVSSDQVFGQIHNNNDVYYDEIGFLQIQLRVITNYKINGIDPTEPGSADASNVPSRAPMKAPTIGFDDHTLYLYGQFGGLTLELVDNGTTVYSTVVEPNANEVALPDIPGTYELRLCDDRFVYSCEIDI